MLLYFVCIEVWVQLHLNSICTQKSECNVNLIALKAAKTLTVKPLWSFGDSECNLNPIALRNLSAMLMHSKHPKLCQNSMEFGHSECNLNHIALRTAKTLCILAILSAIRLK